jgi:hypothetical protein
LLAAPELKYETNNGLGCYTVLSIHTCGICISRYHYCGYQLHGMGHVMEVGFLLFHFVMISQEYPVLVDILGYTVHPIGDGNCLKEIGGENMYLKWISFLDLILGNI